MTDEALQQESEVEIETAEQPDYSDRRAALAAAFDRPRDDAGRFASMADKDGTGAASEGRDEGGKPPPRADGATPLPDGDGLPRTITDEQLNKLGLKKDYWDKFRDPDIYSEVERRFQETQKGLEQYRGDAEFGTAIRQTIQPYMATIQSMGVEPHVAVQHLLAADHALRYGNPQQKQQLIARLAQSYGVELPTGEPREEGEVINELRNTIYQLQARQQQLEQGWQSSALTTASSEVEAFANGREFFDAVREDMAFLLETGKASTLEEAYTKAIRLNDEISAQVEARQRDEAEKKRREEAAQKAAAAKQAAVSVKGSPVADRPAPSPQDRRAQIAAAFEAR